MKCFPKYSATYPNTGWETIDPENANAITKPRIVPDDFELSWTAIDVDKGKIPERNIACIEKNTIFI